MKNSTRARVAAAVGAAANSKKVSSVFDYSAGAHRSMSAQVSESGRLRGFDYGTSSHFSGGGNNKLDFFDYETSSHVQLKLKGRKFSGYDYDTGSHFSGTINGRSLSVFDYGAGQHYNFTV